MARPKLIPKSDVRQRLFVRTLRQLNCFDQIVKKFVAGESATSVAKWAFGLKVEGPAGRWTELTWWTYLKPLRTYIVKTSAGAKQVNPKPLEVQAVRAAFQSQTEELAFAEPGKEVMAEQAWNIWKKVKKAARDLNAETTLKYAFVIQQARVEIIIEQEKKLGLLMPDAGTRAVVALKDIAAEIRKFEVGEEYMRGRGGSFPHERPYPGGLVPRADVKAPTGFEQLNAVDRNLIREASVKLKEILIEEIGGKFTVDGLAIDTGGRGGKR